MSKRRRPRHTKVLGPVTTSQLTRLTKQKELTMHKNTIAPARLRLGALAGSAALALCALTAAPAYAHDSLIASTPEAGEVLSDSPDEVVLEFSGAGLTTGDAINNEIWILDAEEENWASDEPAEVDGNTMRTDIPEPLPNGEYEVYYRVVYSDGHDEELSFGFEVDAPAAEEDDDAQLAEPEETEASAEPTEFAEPEDAETVPVPTAEDQEPEGSLAETEDEAVETSGQWPGILGWGALVAAVLALAAVTVYAVRRRSLSNSDDPAQD